MHIHTTSLYIHTTSIYIHTYIHTYIYIYIYTWRQTTATHQPVVRALQTLNIPAKGPCEAHCAGYHHRGRSGLSGRPFHGVMGCFWTWGLDGFEGLMIYRV